MEKLLIFDSAKEVRFGKLLKFIIPTYLTALFNTVYTIVDGIFVSSYVGTNALAAINIVYPIVNILTGIALAFATGGSALAALHVAKQINTVIAKEEKKERRVLTIRETELFLEQAKGTFYENLFILALETGLRVGELSALQWEDIDFKKKVIHVKHTLCYFSKNGKYVFEMHDTKTNNGKRTIPLTAKAINSLKCQKLQKQEIILKGKTAKEEFQNLVFVTKNNQPTQQFLINQCMQLVIQNMNKAGIDFSPFTLHTLRHTFATRAIECGMNPKTLQKLLGHGTLQMTMDLYCHVTEDTLFLEMEKFEKRCS